MNSHFTIKCCYDSHVHWRGTGQFARDLRLDQIRSFEDIKKIKLLPSYFRGNWLIGRGWDQNHFLESKMPDRFALDQIFPDFPVAFTRVDGHALWVNSVALKKVGFELENASEIFSHEFNDQILIENGRCMGIFFDQAMSLIEKHIPTPSIESLREDLLLAQRMFHRAGFTHIRDLTCDDDQWEIACRMEEKNELRLCVDQFFSAESLNFFDQRLKLALRARKDYNQKISNGIKSLLRPKGIKIYYDGALGSEGAYLSEDYLNRPGHRGFCLMDKKILSDIMIKTFNSQLELAVHAIGDQAAEDVVNVAYQLKRNRGLGGRLHIEHAELLRDETIQKMKELNVTCHMQPCHWLSDQKWLRDKIGERINQAFRWRDLEENNISFYFGSDSPIEESSILNNLKAVSDAEEKGIRGLRNSFYNYHQHPDHLSNLNTYTIFESDHIKKIIFEGEAI